MLGGFSSKNGPVSFEFPSTSPPPRTPKEWKRVVIDIKRLYLRRMYKQCASRCVRILDETGKENIHPIYRTFLSFYAAISYEFLGRAAHLYSVNKINLLASALQQFVDCGEALPALVALPLLPRYDDSSQSSTLSPGECLAGFEPPGSLSPQRNSVLAGITRLIDASLLELDDPFLDDDGINEEFSVSSGLRIQSMEEFPVLSPSRVTKSTKDPVKREAMRPFPLRIKKSNNSITAASAPRKCVASDENSSVVRSNSRFRPPRLPLRVIPCIQLNIRKEETTSPASDSLTPSSVSTMHAFSCDSSTNTPNTTPASEASSKELILAIDNLTPARAAQIVRSNRGIAFLREQIDTSVYELRVQIQHIKEIQELRRAKKMQRATSTSLWSFNTAGLGDDPEMFLDAEPAMDVFGNLFVKESKEQRILRLRAEGWETVGLRSPRSTWKGPRYYQEFCAMVMTELNLDS